MEVIRKAIRAGDADHVRLNAHSLKGAVGLFGAEQAYQAAYQLEKVGSSGDLSRAEDAYEDLCVELHRLLPALKSHQPHRQPVVAR
jgi:HPt (histidine-containing phosphotransfer) domain-containing protein